LVFIPIINKKKKVIANRNASLWYNLEKLGGAKVKQWLVAFYLLMILCGSVWNVYLSWKHDYFGQFVFFSFFSLISFFLFAASLLYAINAGQVHDQSASI
jgi:hypothetical protein